MVTARQGRDNARVTYADLRERGLKISSILKGLGVEVGSRVATLAWNAQAHVETWCAVMDMGAVCHTLNPRLTAEQLAWMLDQSEARIIFVSADLTPLAMQVADRALGVEQVFVIDGASDLAHPRARVEAIEPLIADALMDVRWGQFDENAPSGLCFTSGSTGMPKGVTYTHRSSFLHTWKLLQADVLALQRGCGDAGVADLTRCHEEAEGSSVRIRHGVELGVHAALRASDQSPKAPFLPAGSKPCGAS